MKPITNEAYKLIHDGCIALAEVEANGIRIDTDYLHRAIDETTKEIRTSEKNLLQHDIGKRWKKKYGSRFKWDAGDQLGDILFNEMGYKPTSYTEKTHKPKTDEESLKSTGLEFVNDYITMKKLRKAKSTYLIGNLRETVNGFMHPFFDLHTPVSYRGSSSSPNFTNQPVRDPVIRKLVRQAFIAREGGSIIEVDFKGAEISGATCYHHDPNMIKYLENSKLDMHRDLAAQIYMIKKREVYKDIRDCGKGMFIFPQFYGDYYLHCAESLWEAIDIFELHTPDGVGLKEHLKSKGVKKLGKCDPKQDPKKGTFERHLKEVENDFWNNRFEVYQQWKWDWWNLYQDQGYLDTLTGFRLGGSLMNRKQAVNYPIQGTAFHWLLWSLIRIQKLLHKYKMKSLIIGQIHDSLVGDVPKRETKDYLKIVKQVITEDIFKHWKWICVPLNVEAEMTPVNGNWYQKEEVAI